MRGEMNLQRGAPGRRSRGRPRSGKAEMIESELLEGAFRAFLRNGYAGTSLSQIVKSLGISKTTLYSRYPSKPELFQAIITRQTEGISAGTVLVGGAPLALDEGLRVYATSMMELSLEGDLLQINRLIYSESHRFPELGIAAANRSEHGILVVSRFIAECAVRDAIPCRDAAGIAAAFIFMLRGWYVNVMLTNEPVSKAAIRRFAEQAVRVLIAGRAEW
jgi:TetR/AcrR family transcriptional regulator, mexJK operon transcriptional repressor